MDFVHAFPDSNELDKQKNTPC